MGCILQAPELLCSPLQLREVLCHMKATVETQRSQDFTAAVEEHLRHR